MCRAVLPGFPGCLTAVMGGLVQNELFSLSPFTWQEELGVGLWAAPITATAAPCSTEAVAEPGASLPAPLCKQREACGMMFHFFGMPVASFSGVAVLNAP